MVELKGKKVSVKELGGAGRIGKKKIPDVTDVMGFVIDLYFREVCFNVNLYLDFIPMN